MPPDSPSSTDGAGRAESIIARGIAQPWSDYERQARSIVGDLRAAGFEIVERERTRVLEEALSASNQFLAIATVHPETINSEAAKEQLARNHSASLAAVAVEDEGLSPAGRDAMNGEPSWR